MNRRVALVAAGARSASAVASRMDAFACGLTRRGWSVDLIDLSPTAVPRTQAFLDGLPTPLRWVLERGGFEGDVLPLTARRALPSLRDIRADVALVSVPPFSLLQAAQSLPPKLPLVIDYRDPWSARHTPSPLARATRPLERRALKRATALTYAGGSTLGKLLAQRLRLSPVSIVSVPNGFDPADLQGVPSSPLRSRRNGTPLDLVFGGYWYGRNGPGILLHALDRAGPSVAALAVIGGVSPSISRRAERARCVLSQHEAMPRSELYRRLARADAAIIALDNTSAVESRIPAKAYDYLAVGVPVIAICPPDAAVLQIPDAARFHHIHHRDVNGLVTLLCRASDDRTVLHAGAFGNGPTRDEGVEALDGLLRLCDRGVR